MLICRIDRTDNFPTIAEFGIKRLFRLTLEFTTTESLLPFVRFGLTVKNPLTGKIRHYGFDAE